MRRLTSLSSLSVKYEAYLGAGGKSWLGPLLQGNQQRLKEVSVPEHKTLLKPQLVVFTLLFLYGINKQNKTS